MKNWRTFSLKTLLVLTAICAIYLSWRVYKFEHGVIDEWVDAVLVDSKSNPFENYVLSWPQANQAITIPCQADIPAAQQIKLLRKSLRWLPTEQRRNCVLKIIAEQFPEEAHDLFIQISKETKHEHLIRNTLLLSSIFRIENDIAYYEQFLSHQSGLVRSAAVDAIGMVHHPSFPIPAGSDNYGLQLGFQSDPRIHLRYIADLISDESDLKRRHTTSQIWNDQSERALSPKAKEKIKQLLINDPDPQVRSAAARAARNWHPKNYQLRLAEWGVWINEGENLVLAQSIVDEIPPFVHRVGNDMNSITSGRTNAFIIVTKPIIHFLVDQSMVVDISVRISGGRPWFGYPMPDDFSVTGPSGMQGSTRLSPKDTPADLKLDQLKNLREGYPWLFPSHTKPYINSITGVGFRWQTLFVSPEKLDWMDFEKITDDKFVWWSRLRDVETSWVSNRGESERFLYYDGPTEHPSPVKATIESDQVNVEIPWDYWGPRDVFKRTHMFIEVADDTISATTNFVTFRRDERSIEIPIDALNIRGDQVENKLMEMLSDHGLNQSEAKGLVDCWRPQFFETEGQRLLTFFDKHEYDQLCPITVSPTPTEFSRVGIVLTEFGDE